MKYRNPDTGDIFKNINDACHYFCNEFSGPCYQCPICGDDWNCFAYVLQHPEEAAKRMGMEIIEDSPYNSAGTCGSCVHFQPFGIAGVGKCAMTGRYLPSEHKCDIKENSMEQKDEHITETVDHPAHYNQGGVECIDALKAATVGLEGIQAFCTANAIKYLWRWKSKGGAEDLDKAIWYINRLKEEIGNG